MNKLCIIILQLLLNSTYFLDMQCFLELLKIYLIWKTREFLFKPFQPSVISVGTVGNVLKVFFLLSANWE